MTRIAAKLAEGSGGNSDLVDCRGVGQPFKYTGRKDQDFSEWDHKFRIFVAAKFGQDIVEVLAWARKQRRQIVAQAMNEKQVSYEDEYGEGAD